MKALRPSLHPSGSGIVASVRARPPGSEGEGRAAEEPRPPIVALVCSAGGLQALPAVLDGLPAGFRAPVVVAQHQQPTHLSESLARRCLLAVVPAEPGRPLRPGVVVAVPPGTHALVTLDGRPALIASDWPPPYRPRRGPPLHVPPVAAGARPASSSRETAATAPHDFGGTVIASDRAAGDHFSMPGAAIGRDDVVDHVVPLAHRTAPRLLPAEVTPAPSAAAGDVLHRLVGGDSGREEQGARHRPAHDARGHDPAQRSGNTPNDQCSIHPGHFRCSSGLVFMPRKRSMACAGEVRVRPAGDRLFDLPRGRDDAGLGEPCEDPRCARHARSLPRSVPGPSLPGRASRNRRSAGPDMTHLTCRSAPPRPPSSCRSRPSGRSASGLRLGARLLGRPSRGAGEPLRRPGPAH